jgi:hypothetical protein
MGEIRQPLHQSQTHRQNEMCLKIIKHTHQFCDDFIKSDPQLSGTIEGHLQLIGEEELDEDSLIAVDNQLAEEPELSRGFRSLFPRR